MNYYRRYIGDYMRDTMHLSLIEHGVYTVLLDAQYATEQPLPVEAEALCRICRAHTKEECKAVQSVALRYFPVIDGGRMNPRAARELAIGTATIKKMRENGAAASRARWGTDRALHEDSDATLDTAPIHPPTTNHQPPNHHPTNLQPPTTNRGSRALARATRLPNEFSVPSAWIAWAQGEQPTWTPDQANREAEKFKDYWISKGGKDGRKVDWQATWRNWVRNAKPMQADRSGVAERNNQAAEEWLKSGSIPGEAKRVKTGKA